MFGAAVDCLQMMIMTFAQVCGGNMGAGILGVSLAVRVAMMPLTLRFARSSMEHQLAMKELQPELQRIREKYRKQPQRVAEETQKLMRAKGISLLPMTSCLGALIQMPVFCAMYAAVRNVAALGGRFLWIPNIARPDVLLTTIVAGITFCSITYSTSASPSQEGRQWMLLMPVVVTVLVLAKTSAGLGLYWGLSSLISLLQTFLIRRGQRQPVAVA